jgi:hypothetical protein
MVIPKTIPGSTATPNWLRTPNARPVEMKSTRAWVIIFIGILLFWNVATFGYVMWMGVSPLPFGDQWGSLFPEQSIRNLFAQHNEHRPTLTRLIGLLDWYLADARNTVNLSFIALCYPAFGFALFKLVNRIAADWRRAAVVTGLAFATALSAAQWENMTWGFQTGFVASFVCAFLALFFASLAAQRHPSAGWQFINVLLCLFASFFAVFSLASGLLILPLVIALFFISGASASLKCGYAAFAIAMFAFYLYGYSGGPVEHANPLVSLRDVWAVARFTLAYIGSPFARGDVDVASAVGALGALVLIALIVNAVIALWREPRLLDTPKLAAYVTLLLFAVFVISAGGLTALGRINLGIRQPLAPRYATPALLFWADLIAACLIQSYLHRHAYFRIFQRLGAIMGVVLASYVAAYQIDYIPVVRKVRAERFDAAIAYLIGIRNQPVVLALYPIPSALLAGHLDGPFQRLQRSRKSIFTVDWADRLGTPLREWNLRLGPGCRGAVDRRAIVPDQATPISQLEGWAWDDERERAPDLIVFTDAAGLVVGFGGLGVPRADVRRAHAEITSDDTGWKGFVRADRTVIMQAYGVIFGRSNRACEFAVSVAAR